MHRVGQTDTTQNHGDCFAACVASILECPLNLLPQHPTNGFMYQWGRFLERHGIVLYGPPTAKGVYHSGYWIATVPSLNNEDGWHAIVMHEDKVAWDPNPAKKYKTIDLEEIGSHWLLVLSDISLFRGSPLCVR